MKLAIPITYEKGYLESHFRLPDGSVCIMDDLSYIYTAEGKRCLCITNIGMYDTSRTKHIVVYNDDLTRADINQQYFVQVEVEQEWHQ